MGQKDYTTVGLTPQTREKLRAVQGNESADVTVRKLVKVAEGIHALAEDDG